MLIIPTTAERKNLANKLTQTNRLGSFTATLEVEPFDYKAQFGYLRLDDLKKYNIQAYIDSPERMFNFAIFLPRGAVEGTVRVSTNPYSDTTAYAVYLAAFDGGIKFFIGSSGFVKYKYYPAEARIEGDFEYRCVLGKIFKGSFNVNEE
ncbi:hypothetical protein K9857_22180 [Pseudomonas sp. REP124]|uniref:hypothetical protein n=1 Tax=Pseudomonas sp. REP124 TaxID=2875731 RepID=UPI001CCB1784|nr:hypothetical protein [Pseudomonas sp. REP124]MBZ9784247.1 hypothetical protein [Pseudomonas sp. REP124]